jgi:hypothetical protein
MGCEILYYDIYIYIYIYILYIITLHHMVLRIPTLHTSSGHGRARIYSPVSPHCNRAAHCHPSHHPFESSLIRVIDSPSHDQSETPSPIQVIAHPSHIAALLLLVWLLGLVMARTISDSDRRWSGLEIVALILSPVPPNPPPPFLPHHFPFQPSRAPSSSLGEGQIEGR